MLHGLPVSLLYSLPANTLLSVLDSNTESWLELSKLAIPSYRRIEPDIFLSESVLPSHVKNVKVEVTLPDIIMQARYHQQQIVVRL